MRCLNTLMRAYLSARIPRIKRSVTQAIIEQENCLRYLTHRAANTTFGKTHHFSKIINYSDYANTVPLSVYEDYKPYIEEIGNGKKDVLWPGRVHYFAKSSGTTNRSKFIPLTDEAIYLNHVKGGKDLMAVYYHRYRDAAVFAGKSFISGGHLSDRVGRCPAGDVSAVLLHRMPAWLQYFREPSRRVATMPNWEQKVETIARHIVHENITTLSGVPTWILIILRRVLEISRKDCIMDVWPRLELFVHGGMAFEPYQKTFEQLVGKPIRYINAYNASEGFFAFQDTESDNMWLHTDCGIFYEFIPFTPGNTEKENVTPLPLRDVETGKKYAMVISTNGGLWRYQTGDVVEFTSCSPYRLRWVGRTLQTLNTFGEEVMIQHTDRALSLTCEASGAIAGEYSVAPVFTEPGKGYHRWVVEFQKLPPDMHRFATLLDKYMRELNSDYDAKRHQDIILQPLKIDIVKNGTFHTWMKQHNKTGGQNKPPRLSTDTRIMKELMDISHSLL
ncbi:MAG: GH3 auxin-responsive promoter family protein [Chitinophagales bacterium]|nr:GH3 auxin-responsive promoter family protein [Chitinophagales bacterium]MDW8417854.1 GH3 auxin-responsive promoter family protein [Chitinophagales bacterium]